MPLVPTREEPRRAAPARPVSAGASDTHRDADRILLTRYSPPTVLVDSDLEILQFRGDTGLYLAPAPGKASLNLLKMLRNGLVPGVRAAIQRARKDGAPVHEEGLHVTTESGSHEVNVEVIPMRRSGRDLAFLITFHQVDSAQGLRDRAARVEADAGRKARRKKPEPHQRETGRLKAELEATREYLQSVIEQQEAANEELQSANEEVQSANEELQSINEELETSKEEIQSANEELATVNDELEHRNEELTRVNNDFANLLSSANMAIVMLGPDLRIRRFTPMAEKMLNLIAGDLGRPITDIKLPVAVPDLEQVVSNVVDSMSVWEQEVQDKNGRWYLIRVRPYRTMENKIEGAVVMLLDVDVMMKHQQPS